MALIALGEGDGLKLDQGALLILGAAVCTASASIVQKPLFARHKPLTVSAWNMVIGALALSPPCRRHCSRQRSRAGRPRRRDLPRHRPEPRRLWQLGRRAVAPAGIARHQLPLLRAACRDAYRLFWLGEVPGLVGVVGGLLALGGVVIVNLKRQARH